MPRFSLLMHDSPRGWHCDLLLESGGVLKTWALPSLPENGVEVLCDSLPDHRLLYLDYEGPISGDRGTVSRWDTGTYSIDEADEMRLIVDLHGTKLIGRASLRKLPEMQEKWQFGWCDLP